jgi:hypothetical protein
MSFWENSSSLKLFYKSVPDRFSDLAIIYLVISPVLIVSQIFQLIYQVYAMASHFTPFVQNSEKSGETYRSRLPLLSPWS